jgi:hypothetical protein
MAARMARPLRGAHAVYVFEYANTVALAAWPPWLVSLTKDEGGRRAGERAPRPSKQERYIVKKVLGTGCFALMVCLFATGCDAFAGAQGPAGKAGAAGAQGPKGEPGGETNSKSGERIRRLFRVTEDGGRHFETWHDEEIGGSCSFLVAADGDERCLPYDARAVPILLLYTDDTCTTPIAFVADDVYGTLPPAFTYRLPGSFGMRARNLSFNTQRPTTLYKTAFVDGVVCSETPVGTGLFYNVEPELPPEDFVSSTVEID